MLVEVCVQNLEAALVAQKAGADRIELCSELGLGGITPSFGLVKSAVKHLNIPIHVLVRPRAGDFVYSDFEFEAMTADVQAFKEIGVAGIVIGILANDGAIDSARMTRVREETEGLHLTFHRAFDLLAEPMDSLDRLEGMEIDTILTSGQKKQASDGIPLLFELHYRAKTITVMPGGGIRPGNIAKFHKAGFAAIHFSGTTQVDPAAFPQNNERFTLSDLGHNTELRIQGEEVRQMIQSVK